MSVFYSIFFVFFSKEYFIIFLLIESTNPEQFFRNAVMSFCNFSNPSKDWLKFRKNYWKSFLYFGEDPCNFSKNSRSAINENEDTRVQSFVRLDEKGGNFPKCLWKF